MPTEYVSRVEKILADKVREHQQGVETALTASDSGEASDAAATPAEVEKTPMEKEKEKARPLPLLR